MSFAVAALLAGILAASCDPDPRADLSGRIDGVMLARQHPSPTVDQIVGGFDVYLDLGEAAPASVDVAPGYGTFVLIRQSDQKSLATLQIDCQTVRHLDPGDQAIVHVTVAQQGVAQSLDTPVLDEICQSGYLRIDGNVSDSPDGGLNTPLQSGPFELMKCP
jgi:hypothetical protein